MGRNPSARARPVLEDAAIQGCRAGLDLEITLAKSEAEFRSALATAEFDAILSDNQVAGCEGAEAVRLAHEQYPEVSFFFVSDAADDAGTALGAAAQRHLEVITEATRKMGTLIEDLLAFSRLSRADLHRGRVQVRELADEVRLELERETAGCELQWEIGELPVVNGDRPML